MERWWTTDMAQQKYSEKIPSHFHFVQNKPHIEWPGTKPNFSKKFPASNRLDHAVSAPLSHEQRLAYGRFEFIKTEVINEQPP
jgi:hypothetical protein